VRQPATRPSLPIPSQYPVSTRHTRLIHGALMVDIWPGRSTDRRGHEPM